MAKKRFGDRREGRRVDITGLMQCCIDLKPSRMENEVYINHLMDVTALEKYIEEKKRQGIKYTYFHAFMMAVGKVIYCRPKLNRFIKNRHLFEHNEINIAFVAKMTLNDKSEELMLIINISPEDTLQTITEKINAKVENLRGKAEDVSKKGANGPLDMLAKLPNIIRVPVFGLIKFADNHDWLPLSLTQDNIYYSSMIISNLGSIKCGAIYHNLANFGSSSGLAAMGEVVSREFILEDGSKEVRKVCEFGITLDERIADGYYFAKSCKMIEYILKHPELLDETVGTPFEMPEIR